MSARTPRADGRVPAGAIQSIRDVSRREFMGQAAAVGGGLLLGIALPGCHRGPPAVAAAAGGQLNAWLKIAPDDSITVIVDRSEMGQGVYTALPTLLAEELEVALEAIRIEAAPVGDAYVNPLNGGQITGTSNSVTDAWDKLRTAGAQARALLISAAAQSWRVDPSSCHAANGRVFNAQGASLSYGQLASAASLLPLPKTVNLKVPAAFSLVGRPLARLDTAGKVDGSAEFGIDVRLPGMVYAALLQSPVLGGTVASVDSAAAEALPGVRKVLAVPGGVVVVADHYWQALKAREALAVIWQPGANAALDNAAIAALLKKAADAGPGLSARADGAAAAVIDAAARTPAAKVLHSDYALPLLAHATMEPMNCTADVRADRCDLYVGTQVQQMAQAAAAAAAGMPAAQVAVHTTLLGGGFGRRLEVDFIPAAVLASKAVAAPVKLIWTREDDMTHDYFRPPALERLSAAFDAAKLSALRLQVVSPSVTARFAPQGTDPFDSVVEYAVNFPYDVPNVSVEYTRQEIGIDVGYMRSVSHAPNCFAIEGFMDELAVAARRDPFEFRRDLLSKPSHRRVLEAAAERAAWGRPPAGRHQGMAFMEGYTTVLTQVAEISVHAGELKVHKIVCVVDCGQMVNPRIVESQIVGGIVFGLSAALWGEITLSKGVVQQSNFDAYRVLRAPEMPDIDVLLLDSDAPPGGIGEPAVALVAPAVCNAIYAATGRRLRSLPIGAQLAAHQKGRNPGSNSPA